MRFVVVVLLALGVASAQDLFSTAEVGTVDEVRAALAAGGDVAAVDEAGDTPLLVAVRWNRADVVEALLDAGADPEYVNPRTGMGIFGLVWRNPEGAAIRAVFSERGLVANVRALPRDAEEVVADDAAAHDGEGAGPAGEAPPGDVDAAEPPGGGAPDAEAGGPEAAAEPEPEPAAPPYEPPLTLDEAAGRGFVVDPDDPVRHDDVAFMVVDAVELRAPLVPQAFVLACRSAVLQVIRNPETATFGNEELVRYNQDGVLRHETQLLTRNAAGATVRFGVTCSGYLEAGRLHVAVEVVAR